MADKKQKPISKPNEQRRETVMKPKDIGSLPIPQVSIRKSQSTKPQAGKMQDLMGQALLSKIGMQKQDHETKKDKERKGRFINVMTDVGKIKRETLDNQKKITELQHQLDMKKVQSKHGQKRLNHALMVIIWLCFLLTASLYLGMQSYDPANIVKETKNTPIIQPKQEVVKEDPKIESKVQKVIETGNSDQKEKAQNESQVGSTLEAHKMKEDPVPSGGSAVEIKDIEKPSSPPPIPTDDDDSDTPRKGIDIKELSYLQYLQNLLKKTTKLHEAVIESSSKLMDQNERNRQEKTLKTYNIVQRDPENLKHLKSQIFYHMSELFALQLKAVEAYTKGSMISYSDYNSQRSQRSPQGLSMLQKIHEELVTLQNDGALPILSRATFTSPAKPMGLQKSILAFNKFKQFATKDQYKNLEAAIKDFMSAINIDRIDYFKSWFNAIFGGSKIVMK